MSDQYSFVVATYPGRDTAVEVFNVLAELEKEKELNVADAVAVYKNKRGKIKVHKKSTLTGRKGAAIFGGAGLIVGAILGGPLLGALVGAVVGGAASGWTGLNRDVKQQLAEELGLEDSALCLLIKSANWGTVQETMAEHNFGGHILISELTPDAAQALSDLATQAEVAAAVEKELQDEIEAQQLEAAFQSLEQQAQAKAIDDAQWAETTTRLADEAEAESAAAVEAALKNEDEEG